MSYQANGDESSAARDANHVNAGSFTVPSLTPSKRGVSDSSPQDRPTNVPKLDTTGLGSIARSLAPSLGTKTLYGFYCPLSYKTRTDLPATLFRVFILLAGVTSASSAAAVYFEFATNFRKTFKKHVYANGRGVPLNAGTVVEGVDPFTNTSIKANKLPPAASSFYPDEVLTYAKSKNCSHALWFNANSKTIALYVTENVINSLRSGFADNTDSMRAQLQSLSWNSQWSPKLTAGPLKYGGSFIGLRLEDPGMNPLKSWVINTVKAKYSKIPLLPDADIKWGYTSDVENNSPYLTIPNILVPDFITFLAKLDIAITHPYPDYDDYLQFIKNQNTTAATDDFEDLL